MIRMDPIATRSAVAHLMRRTGFGAHPDDVDRLSALGYASAVDEVCDLSVADAAADAVAVPTFDTAAILQKVRGDQAARREARRAIVEEVDNLVFWWLQRMVASEHPLRERLTFHWHDHFATSVEKVKLAEPMFLQRATLYSHAFGPFDELARTIVSDPAMLVWLDGRESTNESPNENFGREFFELFTLGLGYHAGGGQPYTERDVSEAARAFTGWQIERPGFTARLNPRRHDSTDKTVLGETGPLGSDEVVRIATRHPACAPHVVSRLYSRFARPADPTDPVVVELAATFAPALDVAALVKAMLLHPDFLAEPTRTALVRTPVEYVVGIARTLRLTLERTDVEALGRLGQVPFEPPDVAGWPSNEAWLSTASALTRLDVARTFAARADVGPVAGAPAAERGAAIARWLGIDRWSAATAAALDDVAADPVNALTIALASPEFVLA